MLCPRITKLVTCSDYFCTSKKAKIHHNFKTAINSLLGEKEIVIDLGGTIVMAYPVMTNK